jgi:pro-apoptotic serine protease NMA111
LTEKMEEECRARNATATGLLGVVRVLKGGPASPYRKRTEKESLVPVPEGVTRVAGLEPADVLFTCNGKYITDFIGLWSIIDDSVGQDIVLEIFRAGKEGKSGATGKLQVICTVQDLHAITPSRFLEIGGSVIHDLSYQVGRNHNVQLGTGVFCAGLYS